MNWTDDRCAELEIFQTLLREAASINSGSHCLERIARVIDLAARLDASDYKFCRSSFRQFLIELAIAERAK